MLQIVSEHEAVCLKTVTSLDIVSKGSGIMLRCQENWILKCDGGLDRGSPGLLFLKGKLCSLCVAASSYVLVSLSVDPSQMR